MDNTHDNLRAFLASKGATNEQIAQTERNVASFVHAGLGTWNEITSALMSTLTSTATLPMLHEAARFMDAMTDILDGRKPAHEPQEALEALKRDIELMQQEP